MLRPHTAMHCTLLASTLLHAEEYLSAVSNFSECGKDIEHSLIDRYACFLVLQSRLEAVVYCCLLLRQLSLTHIYLANKAHDSG